MAKLVITFFLLLTASITYAEECSLNDPGVKSVSVPLDYSKQVSPTFSFHIKVIENFPGAPFLVFIPGGPGGTSMQYTLDKFPTGLNLILTDPRTLGCNSDNPIEAFDTVSTETLALDIKMAIEALGVKDFILYGQSYGTQVATVLAERLEQENLPPRAVVLEGAVGNSGSFLPGYNEALKHLLSRIPKVSADAIRSISPSSPNLLGADSKTWAEFLLQTLPMGAASLSDAPFLDKYLSEALGGNPNKTSVDVLKYWLAGVKKDAGKSEPTTPFFLKITCTESWDLIPNYFEMKSGEIIIPENSANKCLGYSIKNHYDPADYKVHSPIWYLQGSEDPATPIGDARYHFESQTQTERTFIEFINGGHAVTGLDRSCTEAIWQSITSDHEVGNLQNSCKTPIRIQKKSIKGIAQ